MSRTLNKQLQQATADSQDRWVIDQTTKNNYTVTLIPQDCDYSGGIFFLNMSFPTDYPFKAPQLTMSTRIYHPNVAQQEGHVGKMYVELLYGEWTPYCTVSRLLEYVYGLFSKPDMDYLSVCNVDAEHLYNTDPKRFQQIAQEWTKKYAV